LEICKRLGDAEGQAKGWHFLAWSLRDGDQLDAAEEAELRAINLFRDQGREYSVCESHRVLGQIYHSKGERREATQNFEAAIGIASRFDWHFHLFWAHHALARLYGDEDEFENAQSHIERAKSYAIEDAYSLGRAMDLQADIWYRQGRLEEAKAEILRALDTFKKLGATDNLAMCRDVLQEIELAIRCT